MQTLAHDHLERLSEALAQSESGLPWSEIVQSAQLYSTGFLDGNYYLKQYPDVVLGEMDPYLHYYRHGYAEARTPGPWADASAIARMLASRPEMAAMPFDRFIDAWLEYVRLYMARADVVSRAPETNKVQKRTGGDRLIMRQGSIYAAANGRLHVDWILTDMCNYKCSYCFGMPPLDRRRFASWEYLETAVESLAAANYSTYDFTISGGEPTIHPEFFRLVECIHERIGKRLNRLLIISNGSRDAKLYHRLATLPGCPNLNMLMSLHTEYVRMNHVLDILDAAARGIHITFNLMFNTRKREYVRDIAAQLTAVRNRYPFNMNIALLRKPPKFDIIDPAYTDDDHQWRKKALADFEDVAAKSGLAATQRCLFGETTFVEYEEQGRRIYRVTPYAERDNLLKAGFFNFKGMYCLVGSSAVIIQADGMVKGTQCGETRAKYNIFRENPFQKSDFTGFIQCSLRSCGCSANDSIPKFRDKAEADSFLAAWRIADGGRTV